jgi:hypothetical protein
MKPQHHPHEKGENVSIIYRGECKKCHRTRPLDDKYPYGICEDCRNPHEKGGTMVEFHAIENTFHAAIQQIGKLEKENTELKAEVEGLRVWLYRATRRLFLIWGDDHYAATIEKEALGIKNDPCKCKKCQRKEQALTEPGDDDEA